MYSVVLLMAVTAGGESAECGRRRHHCYSPCPVVYYSYGGCCAPPAPAPSTTDGGTTDDGSSDGETTADEKPITAAEQKQFDEAVKDLEGEAKDKILKSWKEGNNKTKRTILKALTEESETSLSTNERLPGSATIVVNVPADATVTVDGRSTSSKTSVRTFESPVLEPGTSYYYTFKAEFNHDGEKVAVSKLVLVSAGRTVKVDLRKATTVVTAR